MSVEAQNNRVGSVQVNASVKDDVKSNGHQTDAFQQEHKFSELESQLSELKGKVEELLCCSNPGSNKLKTSLQTEFRTFERIKRP